MSEIDMLNEIQRIEVYGLGMALMFWASGVLPDGVTARQLVDLMMACDSARQRLREKQESSGVR